MVVSGRLTYLRSAGFDDFFNMAKILVTCSSCIADIPLQVKDVFGRMCTNNGEAEYRFTCTECGEINVKRTSSHMIETLEAAGVQIELWDLPAELFEAHEGPKLTHEDLLDFHIHLTDDEQFAEAIEQLLI